MAWAGDGGLGAGRGSPEVGAERYQGEKGSLIPSVSPVIFTLVLLTTCLAWNARLSGWASRAVLYLVSDAARLAPHTAGDWRPPLSEQRVTPRSAAQLTGGRPNFFWELARGPTRMNESTFLVWRGVLAV